MGTQQIGVFSVFPPKSLQASSFSHTSEINFLVDENLSVRCCDPLKEYDVSLTAVKDVGLRGANDQDVFSYAVANNLSIITTDRDFCKDGNFKYAESLGVLVLPHTHGKGARMIRAATDAFDHFISTSAKIMTSAKGIVIQYARDGNYNIYEATPDAPRKLQIIATGHYTNG